VETSLYTSMAQRASSAEVLRHSSEHRGRRNLHFQTWHDKAGNAIHLDNVVDPVTGRGGNLPDLNALRLVEKISKPNLIIAGADGVPSRHFRHVPSFVHRNQGSGGRAVKDDGKRTVSCQSSAIL